ncbi:hypothetical protein DACRYDRAFT_23878 [Dacryopinax primogenitus]|uniref:DUF4246 domain-containing protein n=1 Tax=Dacryopinax primogenitus (strain DJM 731) TaxID=1858805 RepID=M5FTB9_DACPD|nr:uncharacterized protein DACRYDRAFT_23878 [Dacryopinax primogenitus]EJT99283.1 hypothetical protein DACRYDRAFT_23878 [Dacryopinax primogenitus]
MSPSYRRWEERAAERESCDLTKLEEKIIEQKKEKLPEDAARVEEEPLVREEEEQEALGNSLGGLRGRSRFAGTKLKVIVKAANYVLRPGQEYGGEWQLEGLPHEHIRAVLIYHYYSNAYLADAGLSFRRLRTHEDQPNAFKNEASDFEIRQNEDDEPFFDYPSDVEDRANFPYDLPRSIELGTVPVTGIATSGLTTGRMISFPNWLQRKVVRLKNTRVEGNSGASLKTLCFFVVNEFCPQMDENGNESFPWIHLLLWSTYWTERTSSIDDCGYLASATLPHLPICLQCFGYGLQACHPRPWSSCGACHLYLRHGSDGDDQSRCGRAQASIDTRSDDR